MSGLYDKGLNSDLVECQTERTDKVEVISDHPTSVRHPKSPCFDFKAPQQLVQQGFIPKLNS